MLPADTSHCDAPHTKQPQPLGVVEDDAVNDCSLQFSKETKLGNRGLLEPEPDGRLGGGLQCTAQGEVQGDVEVLVQKLQSRQDPRRSSAVLDKQRNLSCRQASRMNSASVTPRCELLPCRTDLLQRRVLVGAQKLGDQLEHHLGSSRCVQDLGIAAGLSQGLLQSATETRCSLRGIESIAASRTTRNTGCGAEEGLGTAGSAIGTGTTGMASAGCRAYKSIKRPICPDSASRRADCQACATNGPASCSASAKLAKK